MSRQAEAIERLNAIADQIARVGIAMLLAGESGTDKEAYARLIHRVSTERRLPLKIVSCTALESGHLPFHINTCLQVSEKDV